MSRFELNLSGLNELSEDLKDAVKQYPDKAQITLEKNGRKFKKSVKAKTPDSGISHEMKLKNGYKASKVKGYGMNMLVEITVEKAPHFHLVEYGHKLISKKGQEIGWVAGKHMMEETRKEYEEILPKELKKMAEEILEECKL